MDDGRGQEEYVRQVLEAYRKTPGTKGTVRRADRMLAVQLYQRGVAFQVDSIKRRLRSSHQSRLRLKSQNARSRAKMVHLVHRAAVAIGDHGHDLALKAGGGGIFYKLVVHALGELEILGVVDEDVAGAGDHLPQVLRIFGGQIALGNRVGAHADFQATPVEQTQAVQDSPIDAEDVVG
jgi:hypothetical protein